MEIKGKSAKAYNSMAVEKELKISAITLPVTQIKENIERKQLTFKCHIRILKYKAASEYFVILS